MLYVFLRVTVYNMQSMWLSVVADYVIYTSHACKTYNLMSTRVRDSNAPVHNATPEHDTESHTLYSDCNNTATTATQCNEHDTESHTLYSDSCVFDNASARLACSSAQCDTRALESRTRIAKCTKRHFALSSAQCEVSQYALSKHSSALWSFEASHCALDNASATLRVLECTRQVHFTVHLTMRRVALCTWALECDTRVLQCTRHVHGACTWALGHERCEHGACTWVLYKVYFDVKCDGACTWALYCTSHIAMTHIYDIPRGNVHGEMCEMYMGEMYMGEMYMTTHESSARAMYIAHLAFHVKVYFIQSHVMNARVQYNATEHCMRGT